MDMTQTTLSIETFLTAQQGPEIEPRRLAGRRRRSLVLTDESAGHPFRASLPPHVTRAGATAEEPAQRFWNLTRNDVRGFASVYVATFAAVLAFII